MSYIQEKFSVFDDLIEGIQLISNDWRYLYVNNAVVKQAKTTKEHLLGHTMMETFPGIEKSEVFRAIETCASSRRALHTETLFQFPDGSKGYFELRMQPVTEGVLILSIDVSSQKRTEALMNEHLQMLLLSQELAKIGSYRYDVETARIQWSAEMYSIMEVNPSAGEPSYESIAKLVHPEDLPRVQANLQRAIDSNEPFTQEYRVVLKNDTTKHLRGIGKPSKNQDGKVVAIHGCIQDVTTEKNIELRLKSSEHQYRMLFESIQESFIVQEVVRDKAGKIADLRFLEINPVTEQILNRKRDDIIGHLRSEIIGPLDGPAREIVEKVANEGAFVNTERFSKELNRWFREHAYSPAPERIAVLNLDISSRKEAEQKLQRANQDLEERVAQRTRELIAALEKEKEVNELKSRFVTMASHEFRTPLTTLLSSVFLIEQYIERGQSEKCPPHLTRIRNSVRTLTDILDDFLSLDKLEQGKIHPESEVVRVDTFAADVISQVAGLLKPGQQVDRIHEGGNEIGTDKKILRTVLINLLSNAVKYSSKDVTFKTVTTLASTTFTITDRGIGIPADEQKHIFSKFFRASNATNIQGTGLGLNIVERYVNLLHGTISFTSESKNGTTFIVKIPNDPPE